MKEEEYFNNATELYQRVFPALKTKKDEINLEFKCNVKEIEIWQYMRNRIWKETVDLTLGDIIEDILNTKNDDIYFYIKNNRSDN
jgi:hypothetical protein